MLKPFPMTIVWTMAMLAIMLAGGAGQALAETGVAKRDPNAGQPPSPEEERLSLMESMSAVTGIPWPYLAAADQYERTLTRANPKTREKESGLIAIQYSDRDWAGALNPDKEDTDPVSIAFFGGVGQDGNGDGKADRHDDQDVLYTFASRLLKYGTSPDDIRIALWEAYHNSRAVDRIMQFVRIYETFGTLA